MPRTLPWLINSANNGSSSNNSTPKRRTPKPTASRDKDEETPRARKRDFFRSSPTPPSSPIHRCPSEEYLIPGIDKDDVYMMVEDEFYAVAQTFTQHLHYAEYVKGKREAKLQNAAAIRNIARPTDGTTPTSAETKRKDTAAVLSERQSSGLEQMQGTISRPSVDSEEENDDDEEEDEDSFAGTSLQGLMISPRKRSLIGMQGVKSTTRAAAGFLRASGTTRDKERLMGEETVSEDEDDDLDGTPTATVAGDGRRQAAEARMRSTGSPVARMPAPSPRDRIQVQSTTAREKQNRELPAQSKKRRLVFDDEFDPLPELGRQDFEVQDTRSRSASVSVAASGSSRDKTRTRGSNEGSKKSSRLNEVPTFLL
ncbi:hypothetical protein FE257_007276 [Aspergillus nanangensis]|uniref:Uncharacterized protein n=1 Tax=Aspergillus nanangensis TaxID=2582783 RepID=A0AAD4CN60_ASPNN|nr:hypothetical protein FE257_007276 [Aspergillus nanangensis]